MGTTKEQTKRFDGLTTEVRAFIDSIKDVRFLEPDGKPKRE
jgi:hypothetical protein